MVCRSNAVWDTDRRALGRVVYFGRGMANRGLKAKILVARLSFVLFASIGFIAASMQTGCVHSPSPPVWGYYDQCAAENPSFLAMAECGRQKRLAECVPNNTCSPEGTAFMDYVDSLALSVKNKKMTEAEAMRRYAEYKSGGTSTCTRVGDTVKLAESAGNATPHN
jgi:hypothetical protein